ncbi:ATP-dependent helicase [Luteolibacter arcticus]|uniref:DNA 3'-5' helicase II n=1 Tax=Luteolibacter arcticus TaxID=1581411 RepID=A0ABT3GL50_9BACT|nr:ATP-dependent helicase [Luteolibacter arcticus]MCW1924248.1 ATP-dependent helicase [Luteolibacter arcticus]
MILTDGQREIMRSTSHLLVKGGPGSGKTTISILKAAEIARHQLRAAQKILFLSFARATVSRVEEAIDREHKIPVEQKERIEVETYHSFFWRLLKTHGYLVGLPRYISLLSPVDEAIALSEIRVRFPARNLSDERKATKKAQEQAERLRLASQQGRVAFDLFAMYAEQIVNRSARIRDLIAIRYPVIILDEFQDTNLDQWRFLKAVGTRCRLIALADPEQRIYDFVGADPARLDQFTAEFTPTPVDLSTDNHRSGSTEIALFGNDLLTGRFRQQAYAGISIQEFPAVKDPAMTKLVTTVYEARRRLVEAGREGWSLAVLVPTKKMTRMVSDAFRQPPAGMQAIGHHAVVEIEAAILAAEVIAYLMQPTTAAHQVHFIELLCNYFRGKGGNEATQSALDEATRIRAAHETYITRQAAGKPRPKRSIMLALGAGYDQIQECRLSGDPGKDWGMVREIMRRSDCPRLQEISEEVRNIRLLERGTELRLALAEDWRDHGAYANALSIIRQAFVKDHFSTRAMPETGVVVMNMHKAKGKQFDEVIIFEGWPFRRGRQIMSNLGRIVRFNDRAKIDSQTRQNLRVSVTRARTRTTILTPTGDHCVLLL